MKTLDDITWRHLQSLSEDASCGIHEEIQSQLDDLRGEGLSLGEFLFAALQVYRANLLPPPVWLVDELLDVWRVYQEGRPSFHWRDEQGLPPEPKIPVKLDEVLGLSRDGNRARSIKARVQERDLIGPIVNMVEGLMDEGWKTPDVFDETAKRLRIHIGGSRVKEIFYKAQKT